MLLDTSVYLQDVPTYLIAIGALAAAWRISRGGGAGAVSELSRANEVLEKALRDERVAREQLGGEVRDLRIENSSLREKTNFAGALTAALQPLVEWTHEHEKRDQERYESQLKVMGLIAERLGPDPELQPPPVRRVRKENG